MDLRGEAASLSVQEAMKTLNMTKFTAEELNTKFQYRVQSITRGLGGSLDYQKSIYTAWEYLNRMLARETSNHTEEVLKKVDKTVKMLENPKQLDMIPVRLNNASKKASLIIHKETESDGKNKLRKLRVQRNPPKNKSNNPLEDEKHQDLEKSLGVSALPGQLLQKHTKWIEQDMLNSRRNNEEVVEERLSHEQKAGQKEQLARLNNAARKRPKKDPTTLQLKDIIRMDRSDDLRNSNKKRSVAEKQQELGKMLGKLPKLPRTRTQSQALLFKRTAALNEMFENPRKPSKHDLRSSARRAAWKEKANQILSDRPDSAKRPKSSVQIKSRKATRRSVSKQPVDHILYKKPNMDQAKASYITVASSDDDEPVTQQTEKPEEEEEEPVTQPTRLQNSPRPTAPGSTRPKSNLNLLALAHGPFTPSRIMEWIKSTQDAETKKRTKFIEADIKR